MLDPLSIIQKHYTIGSELYNTLVSHSQDVAQKALEIVQMHPNLNADADFVFQAAMLHDIGIYLTHAPNIHCHGERKYIEHGYLGAEILRSEGLHRHALVCERHIGVGISKETIIRNEWDIPIKDTFPISIEEQIICYADLFFSKTKLNHQHSPDKICTKLSRYNPSDVDKFNTWQSLWG